LITAQTTEQNRTYINLDTQHT